MKIIALEQSEKKLLLCKAIVFLSGALVMSLEIFGFGILAPFFGKSLIVSSVLIAVVFFALSLGYFAGGVVNDKKINTVNLAKILLAAGIYLGLAFMLRDFVGSYFRWHIDTIATGTFLLAGMLFIPINFLLGMILPFTLRLVQNEPIAEKKRSSKKASGLYILSTFGSIAGTLFSGYVLMPYTDISTALTLMAGVLIILAVLLSPSFRFFLFFIPFFLYFGEISAKTVYVPPIGSNVVSDGSIVIDPAKMKKLDEGLNQYGRVEVFETIEKTRNKPIRLLRVNRELHTVSLLDSNELVLNYAKYNRLGGHFNPGAKKALLLGGGGYSYAKYFLGDTPLYDREKHWKLDEKNYSNNHTVTIPILITNNLSKKAGDAELTFSSDTFVDESEHEGEKNKIIGHNQAPGESIVAAHVEMNDTGMFGNEGFVHVHEVNKDGMPGKVVSDNVSLNVPHNIIGHSDLLTGIHNDVRVPLNRASKDEEVLYLMLHRDNGNKRFDQILVDGYEKMQKLDVVEIDPNTTKFAKKYFDLNTGDPRLRIFEEDGRTYLNRTKEKYDIIYIDAFQSFYSVPFELATIESYRKTFDALNEGGVAVINIPHVISGPFFQSEWKTIKEVFPAVRVYAVDSPNNPDAVQNIVVIAFKSDKVRETKNDDDEINDALGHEWKGEPNKDAPIFTDDYAPTEYLIKDFINIPTM